MGSRQIGQVQPRSKDAQRMIEEVEKVAELLDLVGNLSKNEAFMYSDIPGYLKQLEAKREQLHKEEERDRIIAVSTSLRQEADAILERDRAVAKEAKPDAGGKHAADSARKIQTILDRTLEQGVPGRNEHVQFARQAVADLRAESVRRDCVM